MVFFAQGRIGKSNTLVAVLLVRWWFVNRQRWMPRCSRQVNVAAAVVGAIFLFWLWARLNVRHIFSSLAAIATALLMYLHSSRQGILVGEQTVVRVYKTQRLADEMLVG